MKTALLVLGAHRSGTSPFTRVLNLLGADMPTRLLPPADDNVLGFWEPADVVRIHDEILATAGTSWDDWRRVDPAWYESPLAKVYEGRLLAWLAQDFGGSALFVIKDPRMCRLFRLWRDVLSAFAARIKVVIPVRNPVEVARSLQTRNGFTPAKSYLLWLRHVLDAVADSKDVPRCVVSYDALLSDWRKTAIEIAERLDVTWPRSFSAVELEIDQFISARERHHVVEDQAWLDRPEIGDWVKRAYRALVAMTASGHSDSVQAALDVLISDFDTAVAAFGPLLEGRKEEGRLIGEIEERDQRLLAADRELRRLTGEGEGRERRLVVADGELRRLIGEVEDREQRLVAVAGEVRRLIREAAERARQADSDVRQWIAEVQARDQRLIAADGELRRLSGEVEDRGQRLLAADHEMRRLLLAVARRDEELTAVEGGLAAAADERQALGEKLQDRDRRLVAAERDLHRLSGEVQGRDQQLAVAERRLHEIETSRLWRMIGAIRRLFRRPA